MCEEQPGISRVGTVKDDGGGGHCSSCFSGKIRPGSTWVNLVGGSVSGHVLWPLPTIMVSVTITNLHLVKIKIISTVNIPLKT